jgi:transcriptional regulator with XRE-family HTH domain
MILKRTRCNKRIIENIRFLRFHYKYTQEKLSEMTGISRNTIGAWEQYVAMPQTEQLKILSDLFMVSIDSIVRQEVRLIPMAELNKDYLYIQKYLKAK